MEKSSFALLFFSYFRELLTPTINKAESAFSLTFTKKIFQDEMN